MSKNYLDIPETIENALTKNRDWPIKPFELWLPRTHWSEVVVENYINARAMRLLMEQKNGEYVQSGMDKNFEEAASRAFRCCTLAFYFFATTALNAAKKLSNDVMQKAKPSESALLKDLTDYCLANRKEAIRMNNIRNQIVSHPYNIEDAATLSSWGSSGKVKAKVRTISKVGLSNEREVTLDPKKDLLWLHSYLDGLFTLINKLLQ